MYLSYLKSPEMGGLRNVSVVKCTYCSAASRDLSSFPRTSSDSSQLLVTPALGGNLTGTPHPYTESEIVFYLLFLFDGVVSAT